MNYEKKFEYKGIDVPNYGKCNASITISLKDEHGVAEFTAIGGLRKAREKDCFLCGQCIDMIADCVNTPEVRHIARIWKRWHLNTLHAGCEHQRAFEKEPYANHALEVCSVCGHKYGSDWQAEIIPDDVIEEIKSL